MRNHRPRALGTVGTCLLFLAGCPLFAQTPRIADSVLQAGAVRLHYRIAGSGPPLVMIHGYAGTADDLAALREELAPVRTTISVEIRGFGTSVGPLAAGGADTAIVQDIEHVMTRLRVDDADVIGFSMGAVLAVRLATLHPTRVRSLVLISAAPMLTTHARPFWNAVAEDLERGRGLAALIRATNPVGTPMPSDSAIESLSRRVLGAHDARVWGSLARGMSTLALTPSELGRLGVPVLVIYGAQDPLMAGHAQWVSLIPGARADTVAGSNHGSVIRNPVLFDRVRRFLRQ